MTYVHYAYNNLASHWFSDTVYAVNKTDALDAFFQSVDKMTNNLYANNSICVSDTGYITVDSSVTSSCTWIALQ